MTEKEVGTEDKRGHGGTEDDGEGDLGAAALVTVRVDALGELQRVRRGHVRVGRGDRQDEAGLLADELHDHVPDLVLDVGGLVAHGDLGQAGQVDQGDAQHCGNKTVLGFRQKLLVCESGKQSARVSQGLSRGLPKEFFPHPTILVLHSEHFSSELLPLGSACLANCRASEVARSVLAGVTARMRQVSRSTNDRIMSLI